MKTALTVWGKRISPVFDSAHMLLIAVIENKKVVGGHHEPFDPGLPLRLVDRLLELDVAVMICGAISELPAFVIETMGIELIPFIAGNTDEVLDNFAREARISPAFLMPGCGCLRREVCRKKEKRMFCAMEGGDLHAERRRNRSGSTTGKRDRRRD